MWDDWVQNQVKSFINLFSKQLSLVDLVVNLVALVLDQNVFRNQVVKLLFILLDLVDFLDHLVVFVEGVHHFVDCSDDLLLPRD